MLYSDFQGMKLSRLGFGAMRLPLVAGTKDGVIDEGQVDEMVQYAIEHGVNYFDTAYPYHAGFSELVIGRALKRFPRDAFYLATKYPGHQISDSYDPAAVFEEQLQKCGVDYFDFYLLHNVCENSLAAYTDPRWGIIDYFTEQKKKGRIKHLGFSSHAHLDTLGTFLDAYGDRMEFCQIQLNYLDWTLQNAKGKYELLTQRGIPVWVMEPVRGGRLAKLSEEDEAKLSALRPGESSASWGFRFLQALPNVKMILSGMSNLAQMQDNVKTFSAEAPLNDAETQTLYAIADKLRNTVPCTGCRYCCDGCPMGLDIPLLIQIYNDIKVAPSITAPMRLETMPEDKQPSACVGCGACAAVCPQHIDVPQVMQDMTEALSHIPSWTEISKLRAAEAAALRERAK